MNMKPGLKFDLNVLVCLSAKLAGRRPCSRAYREDHRRAAGQVTERREVAIIKPWRW